MMRSSSGEVRQVGRSAPAPEDFDRPVPPGWFQTPPAFRKFLPPPSPKMLRTASACDHIQTPKTGGRTADLQLHQKEGKDFVEV
eukprot:1145423-Pelagomonas_calceolata.AAC.3